MSEYVDKTLETYLVLTYVNSYDVWLDECKKEDIADGIGGGDNKAMIAKEKKRWTGGRGLTKTGVDVYNALVVNCIEKQRMNIHGSHCLAFFEPT